MENNTLAFLEKDSKETGYLVFDSSDNMVFESTDKQAAIDFCNELCYGALVCESSQDSKMGMVVVYEKQETVTFEFEDHTEEAYQNIESQRKETETMNKSHMLYESGSQSEESGQMLIGFVAVTVGACAVAYGVYKIAEPLTTMLP